MKYRNRTIWLVLGLVLISGSIFLRSRQRDRVVQEALLALARKQVDLTVKTRQLTALKPAGAVRASAPLPSKPVATTSRPRENASVSVLLRDPKLQAKYLAARRANLPSTYGPLFKLLGLPVDQIQRLEALLMRREAQTLDVLTAVPSMQGGSSYAFDPFELSPLRLTPNSSTPDRPLQGDDLAAEQLLRQQDQAFQKDVAELLGGAGAQQLGEYERSLPVRGAMDSLTGELAMTEAPLTVDQANRLTQLVTATAPDYKPGGEELLFKVNWQEAAPAAKALLSPEQFAAFQRMAEGVQANQQINVLLASERKAHPR